MARTIGNVVLPKILYHYYPPKPCHFASLRARSIWLSSANNFNDPFDFAVLPIFSNVKSAAAKEFFKRSAKEHLAGYNRQQRKAHIKARKKEASTKEGVLWGEENYRKNSHNALGIFSLTPKRDDLLMWAHYANSHSGFCVGFNTEVLQQVMHQFARYGRVCELERIRYEEEHPKVDYFEMMNSERSEDKIMELLLTKSSHWRYEDEYRLGIWNYINRPFSLPNNIIQEVIIGCRATNDTDKAICDALMAAPFDGMLLRARQAKFRFDLEFHHILPSS